MKILISCTILFLGAISYLSAQQASREILYVGTFHKPGSEGIYVFEFDRKNQAFKEIQTLAHKESPSFLELHPNGKYLYAVYREGLQKEDKNGTVAAFEIEPSTGKIRLINEVSSEGAGPCHVSVDPKGKYVYISNYGGGNLAVYPIQKNGGLGSATDVVQHTGSSADPGRQKQAYMHSIIPSANGKYIYASDLGVDKVFAYKVNRNNGTLSEVAYASSTPGSGPRHFAIHPNHRFAFSVEELSSTIASFEINPKTGALSPLERVPMLSPDFPSDKDSWAADIHVSPDGKFVYASNRGQDDLVIYGIHPKTGKLSLVGYEPTRGGHPRNFYMDEQGDFILVANRDNDHFVMFDRDKPSGTLSFSGTEVQVPAPVCLKMLRLK